MLEHDPQRDFLHDQRQSRESALRDTAGNAGVPTGDGSSQAASFRGAIQEATLWERVDSCGPPRPAPPLGVRRLRCRAGGGGDEHGRRRDRPGPNLVPQQ